jgi:putative flippase GtrA
VAIFVVIGVLSTCAYAALFLGLRQVTGNLAANLLALLITAVANTAANRRFSFGVRGVEGALRQHVQGLVVFAVGLGATSGAILLLPHGSPPALEVAVLTLTNLGVTAMRFVAMRFWMFGQRVRPTQSRAVPAPAGPAAPRGQSPVGRRPSR